MTDRRNTARIMNGGRNNKLSATIDDQRAAIVSYISRKTICDRTGEKN